ALVWAAAAGDGEIVGLILAAGGGDLDRALAVAAVVGHADAVRELLAAGATPSAKVDGERTVVEIATREGYLGVLRALGDSGVALPSEPDIAGFEIEKIVEDGLLK